jgi:hypothetical protein
MKSHSRTELWLGSSVLAVVYGFGGHSECFCFLRDVSIFTARNAVKDFLNDRFGSLEALTLTRHGLFVSRSGWKTFRNERGRGLGRARDLFSWLSRYAIADSRDSHTRT